MHACMHRRVRACVHTVHACVHMCPYVCVCVCPIVDQEGEGPERQYIRVRPMENIVYLEDTKLTC